jgi:hypothetical protein
VKHNVAELEGALLDAAVAKADGNARIWEMDYSNVWDYAGPIIERELIGIEVEQTTPNIWRAALLNEDPSFGPTPLIAAMRAYVASKVGEEIDLP